MSTGLKYLRTKVPISLLYPVDLSFHIVLLLYYKIIIISILHVSRERVGAQRFLVLDGWRLKVIGVLLNAATDQNTGHSLPGDFLCNCSKLIGISSFLVHSWVNLPAQFHAIRMLVAIGQSVFMRLTMKAQHVKVFRVIAFSVGSWTN